VALMLIYRTYGASELDGAVHSFRLFISSRHEIRDVCPTSTGPASALEPKARCGHWRKNAARDFTAIA